MVSLTIKVALNGINSHSPACTSSAEAILLLITLPIVLVPNTADVSKTDSVRAKVQVRPVRSGKVGAESRAVTFELSSSNDGTTVAVDNINSGTTDSTSLNAE